MTFGFPAYFIESRAFTGRQDELSAVVKSALNNLGWPYKLLPENEFQVSISINLSSWGEKLAVKVLPGGVIQAESKCVYPMQCIDWGKNKENVEVFFAQVERVKESVPLMAISEETPVAFDDKGRSPVERVFTEDDKE